MKRLSVVFCIVLALAGLAGCGQQKVDLPKLSIAVNWKTLKQSIIYACVKPQAWNMPQKPGLPNPEINIKEMFPPLSTIETLAVSEGTAGKIKSVSDIIEKRKDEFTNLVLGSLKSWDLAKLAVRADNIANIMHVDQPFREIVIQPDPVMLWGLNRVSIDGDKATIIVPTYIGDDNFDSAFTNALINFGMKDKNPDTSRIDEFCKRNGAFLPAWEQFTCDLAFAMSTWLSGTVEPDYRSFILKSSLEFGHIFTPQTSQWAGNFYQFLGNTNLQEVVENALIDCENPLYQKLYDRLKNSAWMGLTVTDTKEGVAVNAFGSEEATNSGLLKGDIIFDIDSMPIKAVWNVQNIMYDKAPGDEIIIKITRDEDKGDAKSLTKLGSENGKIMLAYKLKLVAKHKPSI